MGKRMSSSEKGNGQSIGESCRTKRGKDVQNGAAVKQLTPTPIGDEEGGGRMAQSSKKSPDEDIGEIQSARVRDPPPAGELIIVYGHIFGKRAKILMDTGATTSFVGEAFIRLHHLRTVARSKPLRVYYADGRDEMSTRLLSDAKMVIGGQEETRTFEIANIKQDCILGKNWHDEHKATIKMPEDIVEFKGADDKKYSVQSISKRNRIGGPKAVIDPLLNAVLSQEERIEVVSAKQMSNIVKRGKEDVFAITIKNAEEEESTTPPEYRQRLWEIQKDFEYIFQESIPKEITGKPRGIEHEIDIEPGSAPPVLPIYRMT